MKKLAIIGAAPGQKALCEKAKEMGLYTIGFAWEKNAVCKDLFFPLLSHINYGIPQNNGNLQTRTN
ncbi:MAG: hypothetical protein Q4P84_08405 [Elusimicrobiales bacterium]|nr:hypothetical protein [Elusimicrobiales bacterium]